MAADTPAPHGAVAPGGTFEKRYALGTVPASVSAEILMLAFADLTSEGSSEQFRLVLDARERHAANLGMWLGVLGAASGKPAAEAAAILKNAVTSHRADPTDASSVSLRNDIAELAGSAGRAGLDARIESIRRRLQWQRERALRHTARCGLCVEDGF